MAHTAYVFDAYGTLFDVHAAVRKHAEKLGPDPQAFSFVWRQKQLEYSWVRALMHRYLDFWVLTEQALDTAFALFPAADRSLRADLLNAYWTLDCYPEVPQVLTTLKHNGAKLAILSNGTPQMLEAAAKAAGITDLLDEIFSVDALRTYKTDERVYELVTTHFRVYPETISFQSSNRWDIAGATAFGFRTVWMNRAGLPDEYPDLAPVAVLGDLTGLPALG
ncbi:haloacid dehalogenase type II [Polymorphum gilvum]|uniref:(S)-2-haloacid dehalogenase n=1 Tax=Polymorphum gilvum (strain LMG 25793 / CGMCC 1.9160 / SL003B-26A1) TaxID=991905 RepID=F2IV72_POLGS|nr:haloacid dehalogenase type II [Polymorphum gilvum]ADZ71403.1 2-haloacid halidohydrolase Iva [Polymorphum gilvum SL003B-26A1]